MNNGQNDGGSFAAIIIIAIAAIIFLGVFFSSTSGSDKKNDDSAKPASSTYYTQEKLEYESPKTVEIPDTPEVWTCTNATSYDRNPNNDNYCQSNKGNSGYYSDCEAVSLDPTYVPSQRGAARYNGCY